MRELFFWYCRLGDAAAAMHYGKPWGFGMFGMEDP